MLTSKEQEILKKYNNKSYFSLHLNVVAASILYVLFVYLGITSNIPDFVIIPLIAYVCLMMFLLTHETIHGHLNKTVGIIFGFFTLVNFHATNYSHLQHHKYTNKGSLDCESVHPRVGAVSIFIATLLGTPFRWFSVIMSFFPNASKRIGILEKPRILAKDRHNNNSSKITVAVEFVLIALSFIFGFFNEILLFWLIPGSINVVLVGLFFIYLPHKNLPNDDNFVSAKNFNVGKKWVKIFHWSVVFNTFNYHGTHHSYPSIMVMHLPSATVELEESMRTRGVGGF